MDRSLARHLRVCRQSRCRGPCGIVADRAGRERRDPAARFPATLRSEKDAADRPRSGGVRAPRFSGSESAFVKWLEQAAGRAGMGTLSRRLHFVRNNFEYPKFDEYTYPSADLQISAPSFAARRSAAIISGWSRTASAGRAVASCACIGTVRTRRRFRARSPSTTCGQTELLTYGFFAGRFHRAHDRAAV